MSGRYFNSIYNEKLRGGGGKGAMKKKILRRTSDRAPRAGGVGRWRVRERERERELDDVTFRLPSPAMTRSLISRTLYKLP